MKRSPGKIRQWIRTHQRLTIGIVGGVLIAGAAGTAAYILTRPLPDTKIPDIAIAPREEPIKYYSPLTGAEVADEAATTRTVTAIMLENSPAARPQSGLKDSGVVFEAIAEGGVTRFLVLYQNERPGLIGPVRSLRMYYVDWLAPFDASVAHIGGSQNSLAEVRNGNYRDIDQFFNAEAYWRATDRYAPHNVYTSFERLDALNSSKGYTSSSFAGFLRGDSETAEVPSVTQVNVNVSGPAYNSSYSFDAEAGVYHRSQGGAPHLDRESGQISPRVVIAMLVNEQTVMEDGWREQIDAIGSGAAHIFQNGTHQEVTWQKSSRSSQIVFTNSNGEEVPLARGQTWITAVPNGKGGVSWQ